MQRVSRQRRHPSATLDWERLIRTETAIYPTTPHASRKANSRWRPPLNPLTFGAAECSGRAAVPSQNPGG
jgi:hypothetical protein